MIVVDRREVMRRVAKACEGAPEAVAVAAAYYMLGGSANWIVRNSDDLWWLDGRHNSTRVAFRECPRLGVKIEWPEQASLEVDAIMRRAGG